MAKRRDVPCPCGLPASYRECCGRFHRGEAKAATAEQLMRSRFSAFARHDAAYLIESWHPATRPPRIDFDPALRWERLEIVRTVDGTPFNDEGTVEFRAHYVQGRETGEMHEVSRFARHEGAWVYVDGRVR
ncbi:YchJ family protein [Actinomadura kijaniata]|uniref:YchJ family protein n=1 Tax=Actinomadura kijaniata TaxID=46161 RepID=UPI000832B085|nr:YchJ family metal-binding protein [Actinomadura kijaniata]